MGYYIRYGNNLYYIPKYNNYSDEQMLNVEWLDGALDNISDHTVKNGVMSDMGILRTRDGKYIWSSATSPGIYSEIGTDGKFRYSKLNNGDYVADDGSGSQVFDPRQGWTTPAVAPVDKTRVAINEPIRIELTPGLSEDNADNADIASWFEENAPQNGTPAKETPGTPAKETPGTPAKETPGTPAKETPGTVDGETPGTVDGAPRNQE
jgi:hypothetical protein